jgi:hypothetical protein
MLGCAGLALVMLAVGGGTHRGDAFGASVLPSIGLARCDAGGMTVSTPVVRPQADGVHLRIANVTPYEMEFEYDVDHGEGGGGGAVVPPGVSEHVLPFAPHSIDVTCYHDDLDALGTSYETIVIENSSGVAKSPYLDCARSINLQNVDARWSGPDFMDTARAYLRGRRLLRPGDRLEPAVAPGPELPIARVVRDEHSAALLEFTETRRGRYSLMFVTLCAGFANR